MTKTVWNEYAVECSMKWTCWWVQCEMSMLKNTAWKAKAKKTMHALWRGLSARSLISMRITRNPVITFKTGTSGAILHWTVCICELFLDLSIVFMTETEKIFVQHYFMQELLKKNYKQVFWSSESLITKSLLQAKYVYFNRLSIVCPFTNEFSAESKSHLVSVGICNACQKSLEQPSYSLPKSNVVLFFYWSNFNKMHYITGARGEA